MTVFPEAEINKAIQSGKYKMTGEIEKLHELYTFIDELTIPVIVYANTISNAAPFTGRLPDDRGQILKLLQKTIDHTDEKELLNYRNRIRHL